VPEAERRDGAEGTELADFAAVASHDLGAPLHLISGYAALLEQRLAGTDPEVETALAGLSRGVERMQALIDGLLAYTRAGDGATPLEEVDCRAVVDGVLETLAPEIEATGATVEVGELPRVFGLPAQLAQLFQNLVANAIRFRGAGPPVVRIACTREPGLWHFTVADNGVGVAPRDAVRIFDMFSRARSARETPGSGIGLAIARRVVEAHRGQIWVEGQPGAGSTFHFTIPLALRRRDDPPTAAEGPAPAGEAGAP
jgi:signal transduction histidine kinase